MPDADFFKDLKTTRLTTSSTGRRIGHSARDWINSIDRTSFGMKQKTDARNTNIGTPASAGNIASKAGDYMANASNAIGTGAAIAIVAGASVTVGVAAALSLPISAAVMGLVGIGMIAKSAYSNREAAHDTLSGFCYNLIDSKEPSAFTNGQLFEASAAALTLMEDGKSQIKLLGVKFQSAAIELEKFHAKLKNNEQDITSVAANDQNWQRIRDLRLRSIAMIEKSKLPGGEIYEFARRAIHTGNYIQAPFIIWLAMQVKFSPEKATEIMRNENDPFSSNPIGKQMRALFEELSKFYSDVLAAPNVTNAVTATNRQKQSANLVTSADSLDKAKLTKGVFKG